MHYFIEALGYKIMSSSGLPFATLQRRDTAELLVNLLRIYPDITREQVWECDIPSDAAPRVVYDKIIKLQKEG